VLPRYDTELAFDDVTVRIVLPEGATNAKLIPPWKVSEESSEKRYTYLDTSGRTVIVFKGQNLVREHNQNFRLVYHFSKISLLQEPLLLVGGFFFLFVVAILGVRFTLSISPDDNDEEEKDKAINRYLTDLKTLHSNLSEHFKELLKSAESYAKEKKITI